MGPKCPVVCPGRVDVAAAVRRQGGDFFQGNGIRSAQAGRRGAGSAVQEDAAYRPGRSAFLHCSRQLQLAAFLRQQKAAYVVQAEAVDDIKARNWGGVK